MTGGIITPAVLDWAGRTAPGARVASCTVRALAGGNVARRDAQAVRPDATAIPELVAWATGWLITPLAPGAPDGPRRRGPG